MKNIKFLSTIFMLFFMVNYTIQAIEDRSGSDSRATNRVERKEEFFDQTKKKFPKTSQTFSDIFAELSELLKDDETNKEKTSKLSTLVERLPESLKEDRKTLKYTDVTDILKEKKRSMSCTEEYFSDIIILAWKMPYHTQSLFLQAALLFNKLDSITNEKEAREYTNSLFNLYASAPFEIDLDFIDYIKENPFVAESFGRYFLKEEWSDGQIKDFVSTISKQLKENIKIIKKYKLAEDLEEEKDKSQD
jgi:hypothetical protein